MTMDELVLKLQTVQQECWGHGIATDDLNISGFLLGEGLTMDIKEIFVDGDTLHFDFVRPVKLKFEIEVEYRRRVGGYVEPEEIVEQLLPRITEAVGNEVFEKWNGEIIGSTGGIYEAHNWEVKKV